MSPSVNASPLTNSHDASQMALIHLTFKMHMNSTGSLRMPYSLQRIIGKTALCFFTLSNIETGDNDKDGDKDEDVDGGDDDDLDMMTM